MARGSNSLTLAIFATVALVAAAGGLWLANMIERRGAPAPAPLQDGPFLRLPEPRALADFALYDHSGKAFSRTSLQGDWTLVFFGFSNCPHICPDTLFQLTRVTEQLGAEGPSERVPKILFVGVDPERDTPEALAQYRGRFDGAIEAVSGTDAELRALATEFGIHYVVPEHEPGTWYSVEHSVGVMLLDPEARWVGLFSAPHEAEAMAAALGRFLKSQPTRRGEE